MTNNDEKDVELWKISTSLLTAKAFYHSANVSTSELSKECFYKFSDAIKYADENFYHNQKIYSVLRTAEEGTEAATQGRDGDKQKVDKDQGAESGGERTAGEPVEAAGKETLGGGGGLGLGVVARGRNGAVQGRFQGLNGGEEPFAKAAPGLGEDIVLGVDHQIDEGGFELSALGTEGLELRLELRGGQRGGFQAFNLVLQLQEAAFQRELTFVHSTLLP